MTAAAEQRLTWILAITCGVLALLLLALWLGLGRGYSWLAPNPADAPRLPNPATLQKLSFVMPPMDHFVEITQRPLFAEDRKPIPPDAEGGPDGGDQAAPTTPLQIALTGVIVTPEVKVALLRDLTNNKTVSLREGMPLPGNQSGWTLVEIHPRKVVMTDGSKATTDVELTAPGSNGTPAARNGAMLQPGGAPAQSAATTPQQKAAEDLRARIEARRKELREQAQRTRAGNAARSK